MIKDSDIVAIGKFQKTHALKGELNAILDVDPGFLEEGNAAIIKVDGINVPFFTSGVRPKGATSYLVKLDGIDSEPEARQFVNKAIYGLRSELAPYLEVDEDDLHTGDDLVGYTIVDADTDEEVGTVDYVDDSTQNLLLVVQNSDGEEIYIPAADGLVDEIDDENKKIFIHIPEGLINLNSKN